MFVSKKKKEFLHPLTDKWLPLINHFSRKYNLPVLDLLQEAYILEWSMCDKESKYYKKFRCLKHKENYFSKSLYHQLYRRVNSWGLLEMEPKKNTIKLTRLDSNDMIDSIIKLRSFNEIYYEELVTHTVVILSSKNLLAAKLFRDKMNMQIRWKELKLDYYKKTSHYKFYKAVKLIKKVVKQEICYA